MRTSIFSQRALLNTRMEARLIFIALTIVCGLSASGSSIEAAKIRAPIERRKSEKQEDDWRLVLGIPVLLTFGLFILGNRKSKKNEILGRKEKKT